MLENKKVHTLVVMVENSPGVLSKVTSLFSRRGYNIISLIASETEDPIISRLTIVVAGDDQVIEQVAKQLNKMVDVMKVTDITDKETVSRQLLLIKVAVEAGTRVEIIELAKIFRSRILDIGRKSLIIEATGDESKIKAMIDTFKPFGIIEFSRTGMISMVRGQKER